jgi:preprotein translocase subunit SecF
MQILKHKTSFDFIGKRKPALFISTLLNLAILVGIVTKGFNYGVDFAGGTVVELKFKQSLGKHGDEEVRKRAEAGGLKDVRVQQIGPSDENSYLLKLGGVTQLTPESAALAQESISKLGTVSAFRVDLENGLINFRSDRRLTTEEVRQTVEAAGTGVKEVRDLGVAMAQGSAPAATPNDPAAAAASSYDYQVVASGMADAVFQAMSKGLPEPDFHVQRVDYVGPQIGKQLRNRGVMALIYAMLAILAYVAFRFDFKFGPGALLAMLHDVIMAAGYFLVTGREFNLTSIAVLLTIIGYSINDTIVIYDRIREEGGRFKGKPLPEIINIAVNETLGRTILTSSVTALSLLGLLIFGVGELFDFAAAMLVGIIVGTYSTVYIASPLTIWLDERAAARERSQKTGMKAKMA